MKITRLNIKRNILTQTEPFCLTDLYNRIGAKNNNDKKVILSTLDELYNDELVEYKKVTTEDKANFGYAYVIKK